MPRAGLDVSLFDGRDCLAQVWWMRGEFTAIIELAPEGGDWANCPEVPGANGQGETVEEAKASLRDAIVLIVQDRLEAVKRGRGGRGRFRGILVS